MDTNKNSFRIIKLGILEIEPLANFFRSLSPKIKKNFHPHPFTKDFVRKICMSSSLAGVRIALIDKSNEKIVGYSFVNRVPIFNNCGYLGIALLDSYQGRGLGKKLMRSILHFCLQEGISEIYLNVYLDNLSAIALYEKLGFKGIKIPKLIYYLIILGELKFNYEFPGFLSEIAKSFRRKRDNRKAYWMRLGL